MEVIFSNKENNNKRREEHFLKLSPSERVLNFIKRLDEMTILKTKSFKKDNFVVWKKEN